MEVVRESIWKLAFGLAKLDQKLAQDIASEVVLLAFDLDESGTPEEVGSIVGSCCIFNRNLLGRTEILSEGKVITILQPEINFESDRTSGTLDIMRFCVKVHLFNLDYLHF